jgi:RNA polymerase sigma-70 factor (ECF subfamily)
MGNGNEAALKSLLEELIRDPAFRRTVRSRLGLSLAETDDVLQDFWIFCVEVSIPRFDASRGEPTIQWFKSAFFRFFVARHQEVVMRIRLREALAKTEDQEWDLPDDRPSAEALVAARERHRRLASCIERLRPNYRYVIVERELNERDIDEIAADCGVPSGTVYVWLSRARARLRTCLQAAAPELAPDVEQSQ